MGGDGAIAGLMSFSLCEGTRGAGGGGGGGRGRLRVSTKWVKK